MTTRMFDESLLNEPDAELFKPANSREIEQFLSYYTVPMFFFRGTPSEENYIDNGSASLIRIDGKFFIVSAGHILRYLRDTTCLIPPSRTESHFIPKLEKYRYYYSDSIDYGYAEIPAADASIFTANDRIFMSSDRILVASVDELKAANDWMVVSGYPAELMTIAERSGGKGRGVRLMHLSTTMADVPPSPTSNLTVPPTGMQTIDLWADETGLETMPGEPKMVQIPRLGGSSGGGCWKGGVRPNPNGWNRDRLKLSAVHIGSTSGLVAIAGMKVRFSREVLIGHHLRMIADDYPDLRSSIYRKWPMLEATEWSTKP